MPTNNEPLVLTIEPAYIGSAVSPTVDITETSEDVTVTITDINGEHSYTVEKTDQAIADAQAAASAANSAASAASTAATRANTSADNADSATTAANSAAAAATQATVDTEAATSSANSAASSATSAAANANAAADRVDTAIDDAESAASAANSAATSATNAASAANTAASNANAKATLADTAASNANTKAGLANTAANSANSAAQSASSAASTATTAANNADAKATAANTAANAANTAATAANDAAARVDAALETLDDDLKITDSASGESVTAADASYLNALVVDGKSVQDGTPTPENPVPVQVVEGRNLIDPSILFDTSWENPTGSNYWRVRTYTLEPNTQYTLSVNCGTGTGNGPFGLSAALDTSEYQRVAYQNHDITAISGADGTLYLWKRIAGGDYIPTPEKIENETITVQLEKDSISTPYTPYGCIGLQIGDTITPIDLQGNVLAGLPDGTRDELKIDSAGHVTIEKRVVYAEITGNETNSWVAGYTTNSRGLYSNDVTLTTSEFNNKFADCDTLAELYLDVKLSSYGVSNRSSFNDATIAGIAINTANKKVYMRTATQQTAESIAQKLASNVIALYVKRATPTTIDLGYITPPAIPSGSVITILATLTPTITPSWWTSRAAAIPEALAANKQHIEDTSADDASIAPVESSTAVANHSVGALIMLDGMLYKVTTAIATGEAITPGTNCTATTVAAELAALA